MLIYFFSSLTFMWTLYKMKSDWLNIQPRSQIIYIYIYIYIYACQGWPRLAMSYNWDQTSLVVVDCRLMRSRLYCYLIIYYVYQKLDHIVKFFTFANIALHIKSFLKTISIDNIELDYLNICKCIVKMHDN